MSHYADEGEDLMSRATDLPAPHPHPRTGGKPDLRGKHVCPFCGAVNAAPDGDTASAAAPCPRCSMADTPATRKATKARIGPWFVRQTRNPAAPGMRFDTLLALVKRGQVTAQSVVRGPTTFQLWRFAANVKGLSRAFGLCYSCGGSVEPDATLCTHCNRMQEPPANPDVLLEGTLAPVPEHQPIRKELRPVDPRPVAPPPPPARPAPAAQRQPAAQHEPADIFEPQDHPLDDLDSGPMDRRGEEVHRRDERQLQRREQRGQVPASQRPPRSAPAGNDNAILSARDLAAAFQLDFKPTMRRPRKWFRKLAAAVILLAIAGGAALLVLNEDMRRTSLAWGTQQYTTIREAVVSRVQAPPAPEKTAAPAVESGRPFDINPPAPSAEETLASRGVPSFPPATLMPPPTPAPPPPPAATEAATQASDAAPPATTPAQLVEAPATQPAAEVALAPAEPPPAPRVERPRTPPPAPSEPAPEPIDPAVAAEQARTLWRQAIDAEARRDFAAAVENYEQIKRLPKSVWPGGLEINLDLARKRLQ